MDPIPEIFFLNGDFTIYEEDEPITVIDSGDSAEVKGVDFVELEVRFAAFLDPGDVLGIATTSNISIAGDRVFHTLGGISTEIGVFIGGADGQPLVVTLNNATAEQAQALVRAIGFYNTDTGAPLEGNRDIVFTLTDADNEKAMATPVVQLRDRPDLPEVANLDGDTLNFTVGDGPSFIDQGPMAVITDPDLPDQISGWTLTVGLGEGSVIGQDMLALADQNGFTQTGEQVFLNGTEIGLISYFGIGPLPNEPGSDTGLGLNIRFNGNATLETAAMVMSSITFDTTTEAPRLGERNILFSLQQGDSAAFRLTEFDDDPFENVVLMTTTVDVREGDQIKVDVAENTTAVPWSGPSFDNNGNPLTYVILPGDDGAAFDIDPTNGALRFKTAPDYENPTDSNANNMYVVTISDSNGDTETIIVTVTDVAGLTLVGTKKKDELEGGIEGDVLKGKNGKDTLIGNEGDDELNGGKKKDKLTGDEGSDKFIFADKLKNKWADKITDFEAGSDMILLDQKLFKGLGSDGPLAAKSFDSGKKADGKKAQILLDKKGNLRYDDGKGGDDPVKFAKVGKSIDLGADDFMLI